VIWSAVFGYLFLAAFVLMIPNMDDAAKQGWNVFFWAFDQRVSPGLKEFVYLVVFIAQLLCGLATVTSASRMIFAFARDGGLPGSSVWKTVSPTWRTPVAAIWLGAVLAVAATLYSPAFAALAAGCALFLYVSYA
ncbi:amino acid permease, partial [Mesorhizobium sp. LSJC264A00]|uniref:amino acid permease n=1 Tax=Mesorhizobium sp. LSJC264A00 TaxID=1287321 RepID=UPI0004CF9F45